MKSDEVGTTIKHPETINDNVKNFTKSDILLYLILDRKVRINGNDKNLSKSDSLLYFTLDRKVTFSFILPWIEK
jgi:hypothetical protein